MSAVMICCPVTSRPVATGIETEPAVLRRLPKVSARIQCPSCGQEHVWDVSMAWLAGEPRLAQPVAKGTEAA